MNVWVGLGVISLCGGVISDARETEQDWGASIRVYLRSLGAIREVFVSAKGRFTIFDGETGEVVARYEGGKEERVSISEGKIRIGEESDGEEKTTTSITVHAEHEIISLHVSSIKRSYRGEIRITAEGDFLQIINEVPLELYLRGVVPCEMPFNWCKEALKAQAVAARTFAYSRMIHEWKTPFDLDDTTNSQVYRGYDVEKESTNEAIAQTAHLILVHQGKPISALYCADCGGATESASEVFLGYAPYLVSVIDADSSGKPFHTVSKYDVWTLFLGDKELQSLLEKKQIAIGLVREIAIVQRSSSGRVKELLLRGEKEEKVLRGADFRLLIGTNRLRSTLFEVHRVEDGWQFEGKGWGHGVGMCQVGAQSRAMAGQDFTAILSAYYRGVELKEADVSLLEPLSRRKNGRRPTRDKKLPKKGTDKVVSYPSCDVFSFSDTLGGQSSMGRTFCTK